MPKKQKGKKLTKIKTDIISLVAHQLRSPISSIQWLSEMLLDGDAGKLTKKQTQFINQIKKSNQRMHGLINTFLEASGVETGEILVESKTTKISSVINSVLEELNPKILRKKIKLTVNISKSISELNIVPSVVKECFEVFIMNSIQYTPAKGSIHIKIFEKNNKIIFEIADTGCGMPKKDQAKVFTKFFRGSNVAKLDPEGSGLGMYLVKEIAKPIGGKVWFSSKEDKGTTVWFSLPRQYGKKKNIRKKQIK